MEINSRIELFKNMVCANYNVFFWSYSITGQYLDSSCENPYLFEQIFSYVGCKNNMIQHAANHTTPLILSTLLDIKWAVCMEAQEKSQRRIFVIGPILTDSISGESIRHRLRFMKDIVDDLWEDKVISLIKSLPVVSAASLQQIALMLHYCVTEEMCKAEDICYQYLHNEQGNSLQHTTDITRGNWSREHEQTLINNIREGNIHYRKTLESDTLTQYINSLYGKTKLHDIKYSSVVFIALCVRAAIDGGILSNSACDLGYFYIQSIDKCGSSAEINTIIQNMYDDFIHRVYRCIHFPGKSTAIQSCCEYINQHVEDRLTVSILAKQIGYADYYLTRKFKAETGHNLRDYIREVKVSRAKFLLSNSQLHIQEISDLLHFSSRNYFAVTFREVTGMSPAVYREKHTAGL